MKAPETQSTETGTPEAGSSDVERLVMPPDDDRVWRYLFDALPFPLRHRWGGDWREFQEGVLIGAAHHSDRDA